MQGTKGPARSHRTDATARDLGVLPRNHTDRRCRPFARRALITARPALVDIRLRNPWVLARLRTLGWYVRFIHPLPSSPWTADLHVLSGRGPVHREQDIPAHGMPKSILGSSRDPRDAHGPTVYRSDRQARHARPSGIPLPGVACAFQRRRPTRRAFAPRPGPTGGRTTIAACPQLWTSLWTDGPVQGRRPT